MNSARKFILSKLNPHRSGRLDVIEIDHAAKIMEEYSTSRITYISNLLPHIYKAKRNRGTGICKLCGNNIRHKIHF